MPDSVYLGALGIAVVLGLIIALIGLDLQRQTPMVSTIRPASLKETTLPSWPMPEICGSHWRAGGGSTAANLSGAAHRKAVSGLRGPRNGLVFRNRHLSPTCSGSVVC